MTSYKPLNEIKVSRDDIDQCTFSHWYPLFKNCSTQSTIIKPLPEAFLEYLNQDSIKLPKSEKSVYTEEVKRSDENGYSDWEQSDDEVKSIEKDGAQELNPVEHFAELHQQITDIIKKYGAVLPKLNWSAPRDATWILPNNTMKCDEPNEIYLLLNASNYIAHDLEHAYDECLNQENTFPRPEFELILKQWTNINPALEFRVFVSDNKVIGISQRDLNYYDYLEPLTETLKDLIDEFVDEQTSVKLSLKNYVLDAYIPRPFNKVFLIDINPFAYKTDSLLFSWNELIHFGETLNDGQDYELRLVKENNVSRFSAKEHSENHVPIDIVEASLNPEAIRELTQNWSKLLSQQQNDMSDSSDDEN